MDKCCETVGNSYNAALKVSKIMFGDTGNSNISSLKRSAEYLVQQISEFNYESEAHRTFFNRFGKGGDFFQNHLVHMPDNQKASRLLRRLGTAECERFIFSSLQGQFQILSWINYLNSV